MSDESVQGAKSLGSSLVGGSDEDFDTICDLCHTEGKRVEAAVCCVDCGENLCHECKRYHKKTSATRNHVLQATPKTNKGGKQPHGSSDDADPLTDRCKKHPQEIIKFFCNLHKQLGCSVCIPLHHRTCDDNVYYIPEVSSGNSDSEELRNIQAEIVHLLARLVCCNSRSDWCQQVTEDSYNQVVTDVKQFRQNINTILDKLEEELLMEASKLKKTTLDSLTAAAQRCDNLIEEVEEMKAYLDDKGELKQYNQLYVAMKSAAEKYPDLEKEAGNIDETIRPNAISFSQSDKLADLTSSVTSLGILSQGGKPEDIQAKYLYNINVKCKTDTDCGIQSATFLPDGHLAVTDSNNKSVKLIALAGGEIEKISLTSVPKDIALVEDDQLVVVLNFEKHLQLLSLLPKLSVCGTISVPGRYNGIAYSAGKLLLTCHDPTRSVHICDMSGNLLQQIDTYFTGNKLFGSGIAVSPDKNSIYVGDFKNNRIVCFNSEGVVMATYVNNMLKRPSGIVSDDQGYIYVCSRDTHTIHQMSPGGKLIQILLEKKNRIQFPQGIAYSAGKLFVSCACTDPKLRNSINVYSLQ